MKQAVGHQHQNLFSHYLILEMMMVMVGQTTVRRNANVIEVIPPKQITRQED